MRTTALMLTLLVALASGTKADVEDINSAGALLPACKAFLADSSKPLGFVEGYCVGKITGLVFLLICADIPPTTTGTQTIQVVVDYIEDRPDRRQEPFMQLAFEALVGAWPCRDAKAPTSMKF
jgi:Rap1a immunity proteins